MRCLAALALVLVTASTAAADGLYFYEAFGGSDVKQELGDDMPAAARIKVALGYRINARWAVEAFVAGDMSIGTPVDDAPGYAARCDCGGGGAPTYPSDRHASALATAGVDVKYLHPVHKNVEVYLRGSLGKGWLDREGAYSGRGLGVGAGIQLKGKVPAAGFLFWPLFFTNWGPKVTAALFVDGGTDFYRLHRDGALDNPDAIDASVNHLAIGWAVGADF